MAHAIMEFEGWFPNSVSWRNNNPGNLKFANQTGATGQDNQGHAIFTTFQAGWNALLNQLRLAFENKSAIYNNQMTLQEFFSRWAEANSDPYAQFVASRLGVTPQTRLIEV